MRLFHLKIALLTGSIILAGGLFVFAQNDPFLKLTYPIAELGNCADRMACEVYCEKPENMKACLNFAETNNLLSAEEIDKGKQMLELGMTKGPGGCKGVEGCESYCDQIEHIKECIAFAEKNNLIPADELNEARKVMSAIDKGIVPPKCKGKKECDVYCSRPENMEECISFGEAAGLIPADELKEAKMMLEAVRKGAKPPACAGKKECDIYCSQAEHMEECMEFGIAAGFMPPEEIENAKKTLKALKQGAKPPACAGKKECDIYCSQAEHMEECMEFGIAAGFIPEEEIEGAKGALRALKQGVKPPNCQGEEACNLYCSQPEHMAECMEFAIAAGFITGQDLENTKRSLEAIKKGVMPPKCQGEEECQVYCSQEEHFEECLNFSEAAGFISPEEAERARKGGGGGPGGCKTEEECEAFCFNPENMDACIDFGLKMGEISPEEAAQMRQRAAGQLPGEPGGMPPPLPGGCQTIEECQVFCQNPENNQECMNFVPQEGGAMSPDGQPLPGQELPGGAAEGSQPLPGQPPPEGMQPPQEPFQGAPQPSPGEMQPPEGIQPPGEAPAPPLPDQMQEMEQTPPVELPEPVSLLLNNFLAAISSAFQR